MFLTFGIVPVSHYTTDIPGVVRLPGAKAGSQRVNGIKGRFGCLVAYVSVCVCVCVCVRESGRKVCGLAKPA